MKAKEVRELTTKEIMERVDAEVDRLNTLTLQHSISPLDNPVQIKESRRLIARLRTILVERNKENN
ncbi:MAG: 50S ribosomal protein L29 [Bacteroidales bacterium]|jgi:large subunit ribosomal protein L29|nr:50S ribosomal protein L29 [Bacteroidales bacterium]MDI9545491.1 50S ribosomal protein L29 [Bacteroidota bacterium]OQC01979.1 MAG: 50S ribosomal protein L29 [Bacteroidetes bacterium ADurb.Bin090]MBP8981868.1 50S ribosomal protein L29 [Bacteroidales bacterium]NLV38290.1 50S ribosomal protein L29 [Bacteroidales bacterium]